MISISLIYPDEKSLLTWLSAMVRVSGRARVAIRVLAGIHVEWQFSHTQHQWIGFVALVAHIRRAVQPCIQNYGLGLFPERLCLRMANSPLNSMHGVWLSLDHIHIPISPQFKCILVTHAQRLLPFAYN